MGGYGSGRPWGFGRTTVDDCLSLDVNKLARDGLLRPKVCDFGILNWRNTSTGKKISSCAFVLNTMDPSYPCIRITYRLCRTNEEVDFTVRLQVTSPYFGGARWWLTCPLVHDGIPCNRRTGKLYLPPGGKYYGCRHCYDLTYRSCQESHKFDSLYARIAKGTGATPNMVKYLLSRRFQNQSAKGPRRAAKQKGVL